MAKLLQSPAFVSEVARPIADRLRGPDGGAPPEVLLVPAFEAQLPGFDTLLDAVSAAWGARPELISAPDGGELPSFAGERLAAAGSIALLSLGTVTGGGLQQNLLRLQRLRNDPDYRVRAAVVHARPARVRDWQTLVNSFSGDLQAVWLSCLPEWSPLALEARALDSVDTGDLANDEVDFFLMRKQICGGALKPSPLFWCAPRGAHISPHSIYGHLLSDVATFVAVGSAFEAVRNEDGKPPVRVVFEMPAIVRSYFDPIILCAMIRWLRPHEAWWGTEPDAARTVVLEMLRRANLPERAMLAAELLLAIAIGSIPAAARDAAMSEAEVLLRERNQPWLPGLRLATRLNRRA